MKKIKIKVLDNGALKIKHSKDFQDVKDLELCDDQGVKVSTHTYDVLNISINKIKEKFF